MERAAANTAEDTNLAAPPKESWRFDKRERGQTPSRQGSQPGLDQAANLGDRLVDLLQNSRTRSTAGKRKNS